MKFTNKKVKKMIGNTKLPWAARDTDKDGVINIIDCRPNNKRFQEIEHNVAGWKLEEIGNGRVKNRITGKTGVLLKSSGYSWKDVAWEEKTKL